MNDDSGRPKGWARGTIGDLVGCDGVFCDGDWVETEDQDPNGDVRLIQLADIGDGVYRDRSKRFLTSAKADELHCTFLQPGDLLVARMPDPLGRAAIFPGDMRQCVTVVDVCIVRSGHEVVDHRWLMHCVNSPGFRVDVASLQSGSTRKRISRRNLATLELPVPPRNEQRRIVEKIEELFSDLDAGVAALERAEANLKRYRTSVLKAAVDGSLTAEWRAKHPDVEPASKLLERILAERRRKWEADQLVKFKAAGKEAPKNCRSKYVEPTPPDTSNLPQLPEGWCWATLPQLGVLDRGRSRHRPRNAPHLYGGPYPFIQTGDIRHADTFVRNYDQTYSEAGLRQSKLWPKGTLCITIAANIAETAILDFDACFPDSVVGFVPATQGVSVRVIEFFFQTVQQRLEAFAPATAQKNINLETLQQLAVCVPPVREQQLIVAQADERLSVTAVSEQQVEANLFRSARLRQSILKQAFEGKLVRQDPSDEPASQLLERIKAQSANNGKPIRSKRRRSKQEAS